MKINYNFIVSLLLLIVSACGEDNRRQAIIEARIKEKIEDAKMKKLNECRNQALSIATEHADSILLHNADLWQIQGDSIPRPPKPGKPDAPKINTKIDSTPAIPLFPIKDKK